LLPNAVLDSAEISHAALRMMTVYELDKPIGTARTHKRCRSNLDGVMAQVEDLIRRPWHRAEHSFAKEQVNVA
jgi:chromosome partitioning protein